MTMLIAVPTGVKFFNWIGTMWRGSLTFETPMLWALGFLVTFLFGGLTGIILSSPPLDFHLSDSYFVVAHFHYVVFGTVVFAMFAGFYFWWPKMTGRMLDETLGKIHFWMLFIGFHTTFLIQHWLGVEGMPRRYADYLPEDGFTWENRVSSAGALLLGLSTLPFLYNVYKTWRSAPLVEVDDPWGYANSLEWATSCPPPRHNFNSHAADPLRAAGVRPAPPGDRRRRTTRRRTRTRWTRCSVNPRSTSDGTGRDREKGWSAVKVETLAVHVGRAVLHADRRRLRLRDAVAGAGRRRRPLPHRRAVAADRRSTWLSSPGGSTPGPRTTRSARSTRAPASSASSRRTRGGRSPLAAGAAFIFAGLAVGWWMVYIGLGVGSLALVGWVFEFYRGEHAH